MSLCSSLLFLLFKLLKSYFSFCSNLFVLKGLKLNSELDLTIAPPLPLGNLNTGKFPHSSS